MLEGREIKLRQAIGAGHKVAVSDIAEGAPVLKYGEVIGVAREHIQPGDLVHVHNLRFDLAGRRVRVCDQRSTI